MSAPKHCRHCEDSCPGGIPVPCWPYPESHMNDAGAEWPEGCCPACAEAERIAKKYDAEKVNARPGGEHEDIAQGMTYADAMEIAAKFARGEYL